MDIAMGKKSILRKTAEVGGSTLLSRMLGLVREILLVNFLGAGAISDAFITAYRLPNSLRKIFAEGALTASFVPTLVGIVKQHGIKHANRLMTLSFIIFEGVVLVLCGLVMWRAESVVRFVAPGFSLEQINYAIPYLRILMPFIFFVSSGALLAGALQSVHHFFIPAFSPVLLNIVFIFSLLFCRAYAMPVEVLCYGILLGGLVQFALHVVAYFKIGFSIERVDDQTWKELRHVLAKFFPCLLSMSVMEINFLLDGQFASYLHESSVTLIHYASRFMGIPLGVFAVAFSTILLPHFSHVSITDPKRLNFYVLESAKLIFWVTVPVALCMSFLSKKIFLTIFLSKKFTVLQAHETAHIMIAFLIGLFFFSLNKILLNVYYSLHDTRVPTIVSLVATGGNFILNLLLYKQYGGVGLAMATTVTSGIMQTGLSLWFLQKRYQFDLQLRSFGNFVMHYSIQLGCISLLFYFSYYTITNLFMRFPKNITYFFLDHVGLWLWITPLVGLCICILYVTRKYFGINAYFLD